MSNETIYKSMRPFASQMRPFTSPMKPFVSLIKQFQGKKLLNRYLSRHFRPLGLRIHEPVK